MWISKQITKEASIPTLQTGKSANASKSSSDVSATISQRNIEFYSPYGYRFSLPNNINVLLAHDAGKQYGIGVLQRGDELESGEIKIIAQSGAYIHLKNDGSVVINGLEIGKDGVIK